jgi:hypothetical protein
MLLKPLHLRKPSLKHLKRRNPKTLTLGLTELLLSSLLMLKSLELTAALKQYSLILNAFADSLL